MNREIKFRAWDKEDNYMFGVAGIVFSVSNPDATVLYERDLFGEDSRSENGTIKHEICDCELMQYTGLKDKNGKEIYEGDIVAVDDGGECFTYEGHEDYPEKYPIAWNNEGACFELKGKEDLEISPFYGYAVFEVIGNIYENPELLKTA